MSRLALLSLLLLLACAACGGDDDDEAAAPPGEVITQTTAPPAETGGSTTVTEPAVADGRVLFKQNCSGCHTLAAAETTGKVGPNLDETKPSFERVTMMVTNGGGGGLGVMPAFKGSLSEDKIEAIARYVSENAGG
jgi:mono/diheme cytochrome c family protein